MYYLNFLNVGNMYITGLDTYTIHVPTYVENTLFVIMYILFMTRSSACFPMNIFSKETFSNFFQKAKLFYSISNGDGLGFRTPKKLD